MAVAVDTTGKSVGGTAVTSLTITSFAVGSGSNRLLFVGVSQWSATDRAPSFVFNTSESGTLHDAATIAEASGTRRASVLYLKAPSNATANIVVSWSGSVDEAVAGADSWTGVDQTTPLGTAVKATDNQTSSTITVSVPNASGDAVHDTLSSDAASAVGATPNQTQRWRALAAANTTEGGGQSAAGTGTNISCTWTNLLGGSSAFAAQVGVAIKAGGAPPPSTVVFRRTLSSLGTRAGSRQLIN